MVTRFANGIYEPLWNRNYIQHVEITRQKALAWKIGAVYDEREPCGT